MSNIFAQTYLQIGADPVEITRGLEPGRMWVKYSEDVIGYTNSGSGKWSWGIIRAGEIFDIAIQDYENDAVQDMVIAHCGNDFYIPEGGSAHTLPRKKKLEKSKIQVIISHDQLKAQGGCITEEQYNQLRDDHNFIISLLGNMNGTLNETNKRTKSIQELIIEMKNRMSGQGEGSDSDDDSGAGFWNTAKWVGIAAIVAWVIYEVVKMFINDDNGGDKAPIGGPAPDPWN